MRFNLFLENQNNMKKGRIYHKIAGDIEAIDTEFGHPNNEYSKIVQLSLMKQIEIARSHNMLILTTKNHEFGAGAICIPEIMDEITRDNDYIIIPSSVHESILIKDIHDFNCDVIKTFVNSSNVFSNAFLSDAFYRYDKETKKINEFRRSKKNVRIEISINNSYIISYLCNNNNLPYFWGGCHRFISKTH